MTIKQIEAQTGMERANIRFYEQEGLIRPARAANGYRDYSEEDLAVLLRVKLLRSLRISLEEIKALRSGKETLADALARHMAVLERERESAAFARETCRAMREDGVSFHDLDAKRYLEGVERKARENGGAYFAVQGERLEQAFYPWRRYFARMFDLSFCGLIWWALLAFAFNAGRDAFSSLSTVAASTVLLLFLEPLSLHLSGTTLGKAVFGFRLTDPDGSPLSYEAAFARTWGVIGKGLGYQIPVLDLVRLWKSYKRCAENETQPWDEGVSYSMKDACARRALLYVGASAVLVFLSASVAFSQLLPPNRGELSVAQFAENYNYYVRYFGYEPANTGYLDANGAWAEKAPSGSTEIYYSGDAMPVFSYELENGYVKAVRLSLELTGERYSIAFASFDDPLFLASFSLALAQKEVGLFSRAQERIVEEIGAQPFGSRDFTQAGIVFSYRTEYTGYIDTAGGALFPESVVSGEHAPSSSFRMEFSMTKTD